MIELKDFVNTDNDNNILYFDTDDDFYEFSVVPMLVVREYVNNKGEKSAYTDFDFTNDYKNAIDKGTKFIIRDPKSLIVKHNNTVSYRTISKPVQNLEPWYYENLYKKQK
jgi:hypothetical protein